MKRFFTLFTITILSLLSFVSMGQNCSADFNYGFVSNTPNTLYFNPVFYGDSLNTSHFWIFGDGTSGNQANPVHTYPNSTATYLVLHVVTHNWGNGNICSDSISKVVTVQGGNCTLTPNFSFLVDTSNNRTAYFQNTSNPYNFADSVQWHFGDSTIGVGPNASHTYAAAGTYYVTMKIWQVVNGQATSCYRNITKAINIGGGSCNLSANFGFQSGSNSNFYFVNSTTGLQSGDSIRWTFGDGTSSIQKNPTHVYNNPGTYQVCLRVKRATPPNTAPCVSEICKTIVVQNTSCNLTVGFQATPVAGAINTYQFQNSSSPISAGDSIVWRFGDGSFGFDVNPSHTYANPGVYNVCLTIQKRDSAGMPTNCLRTYCDSIQVAGVICNMTPSFSFIADSSSSNSIKFFNATTGLQPTDSVFWSFGDSTYSNVSSPVHTYPAPGSYLVCLRIVRPMPAGTAPCVKENCRWISVQAPCNVQPLFGWSEDSVNSYKISFNNQSSNLPVGTQSYMIWNFGDGTSSSETNPVHIYRNAGTYAVCLRIISGNNCNKTYCDSVTVDSGGCYIVSNFNKFNTNSSSLTASFRPSTIDSSWSYSWSFGDGSSSNMITPAHTYAYSDSFNVCLTVSKGANCTNTTCKWIFVNPPINCDSIKLSFSAIRNNNSYDRYSLRASSNYQLLSQSWTILNIAKGTTDTINAFNPSYQFRDTGSFRICLKGTFKDSCVKSICKTIFVSPFPCDSVNLGISFQRDRYSSNKYYFRMASNYYTANQTWIFSKFNGNRSDTIRWSNPYYYFQDTGLYNVCLRAKYNDSCIKETCDSIYVSQLSSAPNTCYLQLFPNPATSYINMTVYLNQPQYMNVSIYNSMNILVRQKSVYGQSGQNYISEFIGNMMPGMYYVRVSYGNSTCSSMFMKL